MNALIILFEQMHYSVLEGRPLEGIARLFAKNVRVYAYPTPASILEDRLRALAANRWTSRDVDGWLTADRFRPAPPLGTSKLRRFDESAAHMIAAILQLGYHPFRRSERAHRGWRSLVLRFETAAKRAEPMLRQVRWCE